ncbi:MAG: hypothetical protein NVS2B8_16210 [Vulcanimicrobiaceae bacterium]
MNAVRNVLAELVGLFVEDRLFALAIALWLGVAGALAAVGFATPEPRGLVLFLGLAAVLVGGIVRGASSR